MANVFTTATSAETSKQKRARKPQMIAVEQLDLSEDFRFRVEDDEATISDYAEIYRQYREDRDEVSKSVRCPLGELDVLCKEDGRFDVVAGRLRFLAAQRAGLEALPCIVHTDRDKMLSVGLESNNNHGKPLNYQDRVLCISKAIVGLSGYSNRAIAAKIGCPPSTVNAIVTRYKLRSEKPVVIGLDGKKYKQRVCTPKSTAGKSGSSAVSNGTTIDEMASARPFEKVQAVLCIANADDHQRVQTYLGIVKDIVAEGFSDKKFQQDFLVELQFEIELLKS